MPSPFEPLLVGSSDAFESFVTEKESTDVVSNTFVAAALMFLAMLITWFLIWSYQKDRYFFISSFALVAFLYGSLMVILSAVNMSNLSLTQFKLFMGSSLLFTLIFMVVGLFGYFKYKRRNATTNPYVPTTVQNYLN